MRRLLIIAFCIVTLLPSARIAAKPSTITKAEARSLPEPIVRRRVMQQLGDILKEPRSTVSRPRPTRPLSDLYYYSRSRSTEVPGLCQIDGLIVYFSTERDDMPDQDTPASVSGFDAAHHFLFRQLPQAGYQEIVDYEHRPSQARCAGLDRYKDPFFNAPDARTATDGYLLAMRAIEGAKGNPPFPVVCDLGPRGATRCQPELAKLDPDNISAIAPCEWDYARHEDGCLDVTFGDARLRIVTGPSPNGQDIPGPNMLRVTYSELIIIADQRVD